MNAHRIAWIGTLVFGAVLLVGPAGHAATDQDIEAWRRAAEGALREARGVGADQWTHTDMVLAEESYRIGNYLLAKERADTAREKTLALKQVPALSGRLSAIELTANNALATAQRAENTSLSALEQARMAERQARAAAERSSTTTSLRESTLSPFEAPGGAPGVQETPLRPAFFDYDSATLRPDARDTLLTNDQWLKANPDVGVTIEGHADERGTSEYNLALGWRRARAAADFLVAAGIAPGRIRTISYGKERPFILGHDESAWRWNRRAHFVAGTAGGPQVSRVQ